MSTAFELHRFEAAPAGAAVAVVELGGRFADAPPARVRLLVERGGQAIEVPALAVTGEDVWQAAFAIELAALADDATEYSLVAGRGSLIALPAPEVTGGPDGDRYIRLARQANELRHRLGEAAAAADERDALRDELAAAEQRSVQAAQAAREERAAAEQRATEAAQAARAGLAAAEQRVEDAEASAKAARDQRESATSSADTAREELERAHEELREAGARATDAERDRAALRARAEAADRTAAELREHAGELEERARDAQARAIAAEDETRSARRDLRNTRARLEALLREQRQPGAEPRGDEPVGHGTDDDEETVVLDTAEPTTLVAGSGAADDTAPRGDDETTRIEAPAADAADTAPRDAPAAPARTATRQTRIVRIADPGADTDADATAEPLRPAEPRFRSTPRIAGDDEPLGPAAVGARYIEPSETKPSHLTPARIMVGVALLLLVAALVAILLGAGIV